MSLYKLSAFLALAGALALASCSKPKCEGPKPGPNYVCATAQWQPAHPIAQVLFFSQSQWGVFCPAWHANGKALVSGEPIDTRERLTIMCNLRIGQ